LHTPFDFNGEIILNLNPYALIENISDHVLRESKISYSMIQTVYTSLKEDSRKSKELVFQLSKILKLSEYIEKTNFKYQKRERD
jgi:hypothetical protein